MIEVEHVSKVYRISRKEAGLMASLKGLFVRRREEVRAVDDVSFTLAAGERVGFLGPNGAGKTTTLKMLAGLLTPTHGRISIHGLDPRGRPRALLRQIALVMGQKQQLLWDLPPIDTLELNRAVYDVDRATFNRTLGELTELLGLGGLLDKPTRQLSLGERMKCELAAALLHRPRVLFLDEPTIGLDVSMQATMRRFIRDYNEATGATIILTSHYMDDVAALCPRVIVIHAGRLRHDGDLPGLVRATRPDKMIHAHLSRPVGAEELREVQVLAEPLRVSAHTDGLLSLAARPEAVTETVRAILARLPVSDLRVEDPPLEEVMQQVFGRAASAASEV
jgi:ABC-2 type transport system ATP-binding protein